MFLHLTKARSQKHSHTQGKCKRCNQRSDGPKAARHYQAGGRSPVLAPSARKVPSQPPATRVNLPAGSTRWRTCMRESACGEMPIKESTVSMPCAPAKMPVPPWMGPIPANLIPGWPGADGNFKANEYPRTTPQEIVPATSPFGVLNVYSSCVVNDAGASAVPGGAKKIEKHSRFHGT